MSDNSENQGSDNTDFEALVDEINTSITTQLADLISKMLNTTQDELFDMANESVSNADQTRYFELMNQLRTQKALLAAAFNQKVRAYFVPAKEFTAKEAAAHDDEESDELSLIGQEDMESIVLVKGIGEKAKDKYREKLSHLEARLNHLALQTQKIFRGDALTPPNFCQAFSDAMGDAFDSTDKKTLFKFFEKELAYKLDELYDSTNKRLIDAHILPKIRLKATQKSSSSHRPPQSQYHDEESDDDMPHDNADGYSDGGAMSGYSGGGQSSTGQSAAGSGPAGNNANPASQGGNNISGFAMTAAPGGTYEGAAQHGPSAGTGSNANTSGGSAAPEQNPGMQSTGGSEFQHYTAGMPASHVGKVLGNYLSGSPITPGSNDQSSPDHVEYFPESTSQHFGHQEIIRALSSLQNLPQFENPQGERFDGEALKQAVLSEIAKTSGGAITKRINQIAEKTIDFIELIFDAIIDDDDISDTVKALLLRLQIPIIKASMSDQEFFIYDSHPARVLLDTIADASVGVTDHTDEMYTHLDKIITTILGEQTLTTETFQTALDRLKKYIEEQEEITRAKEEQAQAETLRKHARSTVLKALRATTTGKTLPEAVHPLILKRWPTLMFNHYLKQGKENNEWVNLVLTLRHIIESVQPINDAESLAKLMAEKDALIQRTENHLNASIHSKKDVQSIMADYISTLQEHIDDANFSEEEVEVAEEIISQREPEEEAPIEVEEDERQALPSNVMPGMWFQVYMGENKPARRCKLSVIIVEDSNLMFVNHKGELMTEKSFDQFTEELNNQRSKMIMGHSAFDYAFKSVIDKLD